MLSLNLLKSQIPYVAGDGGGGGRAWTFKLLLSPNLLKSQIPYVARARGVESGPSNFCWVQICSNPKFPMRPGGGGGGLENTNFQPLSVLTSCESLGCTNQNDTKMCQPDRVSASQIVSLWKLMNLLSGMAYHAIVTNLAASISHSGYWAFIVANICCCCCLILFSSMCQITTPLVVSSCISKTLFITVVETTTRVIPRVSCSDWFEVNGSSLILALYSTKLICSWNYQLCAKY